LISSIRLLILL